VNHTGMEKGAEWNSHEPFGRSWENTIAAKVMIEKQIDDFNEP
jgi:hypothetical protein